MVEITVNKPKATIVIAANGAFKKAAYAAYLIEDVLNRNGFDCKIDCSFLNYAHLTTTEVTYKERADANVAKLRLCGAPIVQPSECFAFEHKDLK